MFLAKKITWHCNCSFYECRTYRYDQQKKNPLPQKVDRT